MAVYKEEKTNTWRVLYRYTDWNGERKQSQKRGFKTKREAQAWEREQLNKLGGDLDMNFKSFVQHYTEDMQSRIKENTWATKEHIIQTKLKYSSFLSTFNFISYPPYRLNESGLVHAISHFLPQVADMNGDGVVGFAVILVLPDFVKQIF